MHYYSEKQDSKFKIKPIKVQLLGEILSFYLASGVFSAKRIDKGSNLLIESALIQPDWKVLDLGCGNGIVGITIAKAYPGCTVLLTDINERAVRTSKMNVELNHITNAKVNVAAGILESKLSLDYSTSSLKSDIDSKPIFKGTDSVLNNQSTPTSITGLSFPSGTMRSGKVDISVEIDATVNLYEKFTLDCIRLDSEWRMSVVSTGNDSGVEFNITASGQIQYISDDYSGFVSGDFSWTNINISNP